jgi:hypothetical protein
MELLRVPWTAWCGRVVRSLLPLLAGCVLALPPLRALAQASGVEYAVKATYLYKFVPFVEWPAGTFASASDPLVICIVGTDPVSELVDEAAKGQVAAGHPVAVAHLSATADETGCQVLYVALRGAAAMSVLARVRGMPVLTVTDAADDPRIRAVVNFVVRENRVRFEIDQGAAADNRLVVSSKLLNLATRVSPKS